MTPIIYRIFNTSTGKSYIGQTVDFAKRMPHHFSSLSRNVHHCHPLQSDYNKYEREMFKVEIIEECVSENDLDEREMYWIRHFDSYHNGYNMNIGGESNRKPCIWNGVVYETRTAAAKALGVTVETIGSRVRKGYTSDADLKTKYPKAIEIDGITFKSTYRAAKHYGVSQDTIRLWLSEGGQSRPVLVENIAKPIEIDGIRFESQSAASKHFGVGKSTIKRWRKLGKSSQLPYVAISEPIEIDGVVFLSQTKAAKHYHVGHPTILLWLEQGKARRVKN
jgi:transposase